MKQSFNYEYDIFMEFFSKKGKSTDERIDHIILVDAKENEGDEEWKGLSQTMKVFIDKKHDTTNDRISQTNDRISQTNDKMDKMIA
jgi:hypothetical protein